MSRCSETRELFSKYLDGELSGAQMQAVAAHLEACSGCAEEFAGWRMMQEALSHVKTARAPKDLALRLRVAASHERARSANPWFTKFQLHWDNAVRPWLLRASAGVASSILLVGSFALMVAPIAVPPVAEAGANYAPVPTEPHLIYTDTTGSGNPYAAANSVMVEAYVDSRGQVYDYRIVSGSHDAATRAAVNDLLLFSLFRPAMLDGQPVRGVALISFSGVSVRG